MSGEFRARQNERKPARCQTDNSLSGATIIKAFATRRNPIEDCKNQTIEICFGDFLRST
jgi:hypothetical protein